MVFEFGSMYMFFIFAYLHIFESKQTQKRVEFI